MVPFRPTGIISFDTYLIIYGQSTEIQILHQSTLEAHVTMCGLISSWPIVSVLFAERILTLNQRGDAEIWKIWPDESRIERITDLEPFGSRASFDYLDRIPTGSSTDKFQRTRRRSSKISREPNSKLSLGDPDMGLITEIYNVGEILWLVTQLNGWCLYKWEDDSFSLLLKRELRNLGGASTGDLGGIDCHWFALWDLQGNIVFTTVDNTSGQPKLQYRNIPASPKPRNVNTLAMVLSFDTQNQVSRHQLVLSQHHQRSRNVLVDFFYFEGEIKYHVLDLTTLKWHSSSQPVHRPFHFLQQPSIVDLVNISTTSMNQPPKALSLKSNTSEGPPDINDSSLPVVSSSPVSSSTARPSKTAAVFNDRLAFGYGFYVTIYTFPQYLLAFESPEHLIEIPDPASEVSLLTTILLSNNVECLLIGTTMGSLYTLDLDWNLSPRLALFGSPVLYSLPLHSKDNESIRDLIVLAARDGTICTINPLERKKLYTIPGNVSSIKMLATPKNSNRLLIIYDDRSGRVYNIETGQIDSENEMIIENEDEYDIYYAEVRPTIPDNRLLYTDSRYNLHGSSTVFVNLNKILNDLLSLKDFSSISGTEPAIINAKAMLSALHIRGAFEMNKMSKVLKDLLFINSESVPRSSMGSAEHIPRWSVPAKLGARGISNTLTVFHAHQQLLNISGEITSVIYLVSVILGQTLLKIQLQSPTLQKRPEYSAIPMAESENIQEHLDNFVNILFSDIPAVSPAFKKPWLRGFARFWNSTNDEIARATRVCLIKRIEQLGNLPKELSLTIARWRVLLPGNMYISKYGTKRSRNSVDDTSLQQTLESIPENADDLDDAFVDIGDRSLYSTAGLTSEEYCDHAADETYLLSTIILGNIAIYFADRITNSVLGEIAAAIEILLARRNLSDSLSSMSKLARNLEDVAIELTGAGWHIWGNDKYFSMDFVMRLIFKFLGEDRTSMQQTMRTGPTVALSKLAMLNETLEDYEVKRHKILVSTVLTISNSSINRVVECCSSTIMNAENVIARVGAIKFLNVIVRYAPELLIDRLFPVVDATIVALDPAATATRNRVVNSITSLYNSLVNVYSLVATHRAQQRLALSIQLDLILVYDLRTGTQMAHLKGAKHRCIEIQFSPEGRHVLGIEQQMKEVYVWKLGHSFFSIIQSIGTSQIPVIDHHHSQTFPYVSSIPSVAGRDLVYPRFVGKLTKIDSSFKLSEFKKNNSGLKINWIQEKIVEVSWNGVAELFDFSST
ncbi:hypothetical protein V1511DRAFT_499832 [Dipodascopsis uninucleata]